MKRMQSRSIWLAFALLSGGIAVTGVGAASIDLADSPVLILQGAAPNLVLTMPDSSGGAVGGIEPPGESDAPRGSLRIFNHERNIFFYNPDRTYLPPKYDGIALPPASFSSACMNAFRYYDSASNRVLCPLGCTMNLGTEFRLMGFEDLAGFFCNWKVSAMSFRDPLLSEYCDVQGDPGAPHPNPTDPDGTPLDCATTAFYYVYDPQNPDGMDPIQSVSAGRDPATGGYICDGSVHTDACYRRVEVSEDEKQNFANWFAYYRVPFLAVLSVVSQVMSEVGSDIRVGYQGYHNEFGKSGRYRGYQNTELHGVRQFIDSGGGIRSRSDFFDWLFNREAANVNGLEPKKTAETPIQSVIRVGDYFSNVSVTAAASYPYNDDPTNASARVDECRRNHHLIFMSAPWEDNWPSKVVPRPVPDAVSRNWDNEDYAAAGYVGGGAPYADQNRGGLADAAFYYWSRDLLSDESGGVNNLLPIIRAPNPDASAQWRDPRNNPATWQHVVTYVVGIGLDGHIPFSGDMYAPSVFATPEVWTDASAPIDVVMGKIGSDRTRVDDAWHAAINSRGGYWNARDVDGLVSALRSMLETLGAAERQGGAASAAVNSGSLAASSKLFQASFDSADWSGTLSAFPIDGNGHVSATAAWEASGLLDARHADRLIVTLDPVARLGIPFEWASLTSAQRAALNATPRPGETGEGRLAWVRGDRSQELTANPPGPYRSRSTRLGDIVNSAPLFVGVPNRLYPDADYKTWTATQTIMSRKPVVYVGANDGMLHAFDAANGEELFAYVPNLVMEKLAGLPNPAYEHRFTVDGPLTAGDAKLDSSWKTVLVGALGKGGQGVFALDVTSPTPASASEAAGMVLWEFGDKDDRDIGYIYGKPAITRICRAWSDGVCSSPLWVGLVPNGYNNTSSGGSEVADADCSDDQVEGTVSCDGAAVLYVLNLANGSVVKKLPTPVGAAADPKGQSRANGLSSVKPVDGDADFYADFAYAGDIFGNLWKFDLSNLSSGSNPVLLFTARDADGNAQPITAPVAVERHPTGKGTLVLFGTGQLLGAADTRDSSVQTFYGIWDAGATGLDASALRDAGGLRQQSFEAGVKTVNDVNRQAVSQARLSTQHTINWAADPSANGVTFSASAQVGWFIDLETLDANGSRIDPGERVTVEADVRGGRVLFVSLNPNDDPCHPGGTSWATALNVNDGSRLDLSPFDYDNDSNIANADLFTLNNEYVAGSSIRVAVAAGAGWGGVYSAPASVVDAGGVTRSYVSTSEGRVVRLTESSALNWRVWHQLR